MSERAFTGVREGVPIGMEDLSCFAGLIIGFSYLGGEVNVSEARE